MNVPYWTEGALERERYELEVVAKLEAGVIRCQRAALVLLERCAQYTG